jgi:hypothetical protein
MFYACTELHAFVNATRSHAGTVISNDDAVHRICAAEEPDEDARSPRINGIVDEICQSLLEPVANPSKGLANALGVGLILANLNGTG